ncbi:MAG TPA: Nif3-like dinuclear metal center hexameric protein [Euzebya sp.]|nr:Nif3-like dinuclear metal center hexameric protein [Euzebya sp.]
MQESNAVPSGGRPTARPERPDRLRDWVGVLHDLYPPAHAEEWDQVGLHVGDLDHDTVGGVLVSLDVTAPVLHEVDERGADLLIAHHPLLFRPLQRLTADTAAGRLALMAARMGIAVVAAHTNVDKASAGTSHPAAAALDLRDLQPLQPLPPDPRMKLVTFVPPEHSTAVRLALADAGAGVIGDYDACSFRSPGVGSFRPGADSRPFIGDAGQQTDVAEERVEVVVPAARRDTVVAALQQSHPYEEVPYDLYPLVEDRRGEIGLGLLGRLSQPTPLTQLVDRLAQSLHNPLVRLAASRRDDTAQHVAIIGGAGGSLINCAHRAGADLVITGDVSHHVALDALTMGLAVIDAGHWGTEWMAMRDVDDALATAARDRGLTAPVHRSRLNTDPWTDWNHPS